jgi:hypothetical protein
MEKPGTKDTAALKRRIKDLEKANVLTYGLNITIDHAEKKNKVAIRKKRYQTIRLIKEKHVTKMGVGPLCRLFGKSRQAYYEHIWHLNNSSDQEDLAVEMVRVVRRYLPRLGGHKLYKCLYTPFRNNDITMGRDNLLIFYVSISY